MRPEQEKYLESLPPGAYRESWRKIYEDADRRQKALRNQRPSDPQADPKVWTPPANPPMMPNPVDPPPGTTTPLPPVTWAEYWEYYSLTLSQDPVLESSSNPLRLRINFTNGLETHAWRLAAEWCSHLRAGDKVALYGAGEPGWTPGFYKPQMAIVNGIYWMSKLAA